MTKRPTVTSRRPNAGALDSVTAAGLASLGADTPSSLGTGTPWWVVSPAAVLAWSAVQIVSLGLGLLQVPLAAKYPAGMALAPEIVSAGQVGAAALLGPLLFRTPATAAVVLGAGWPALLLAGGLAARPATQTALCGLAVSAWLVTLFAWTSAFGGRWWGQVVAATAALLALGGALLAYLATEFAPSGEPDGAMPGILRTTPLVLVWDFGQSSTPRWGDASLLGALLLSGLGVWSARRFRRSPLAQTRVRRGPDAMPHSDYDAGV